MKKFIILLIMTFMFGAKGGFAQSIVEPNNELCYGIAQSMGNLYIARAEGTQKREVVKIYDDIVKRAAEQGNKVFQKRVYYLINKIYALKPFNVEEFIKLYNSEMLLCNSLEGNYAKLIES